MNCPYRKNSFASFPEQPSRGYAAVKSAAYLNYIVCEIFNEATQQAMVTYSDII